MVANHGVRAKVQVIYALEQPTDNYTMAVRYRAVSGGSPVLGGGYDYEWAASGATSRFWWTPKRSGTFKLRFLLKLKSTGALQASSDSPNGLVVKKAPQQ